MKGCTSARVMIPLDPQTLLVGDNNHSPMVRYIATREVARCNGATVLPGRRYVYASTRRFAWADPDSDTLHGPTELRGAAENARLQMEELYQSDTVWIETIFRILEKESGSSSQS
jgi:hypothetical protein